MITAHTDVVGSLLRPSELLRAREKIAAGHITPVAFKEIEDRAVDEAVRLQEDAGIEVVTDGEMRRLSFQSQMTEAVQAVDCSNLYDDGQFCVILLLAYFAQLTIWALN